MSDEYLWDGSGEPDPEIERLECLLRPLRHEGPPPELPEAPAPRRRALGGLWPTLAAAAGLALAVWGTWLATRPAVPAWEVARLEGAPVVGSGRLKGTGRLVVGQWLETDEASRAQIKVGEIGRVEVDPRTRVRLVDAGARSHRLSLARGRLHATIWAPPRNFFVETSSAVAVDLGCSYTLEVDESGAGLLRVATGWVGFERDGRESIVPAGALCLTRPGIGPGTPFFETASAVFQDALMRLDFEPLSDETRSAALDMLLAEARPRDALTLWHLLSRLHGPQRESVYERLASLVPPPRGVTRAGILAADPAMLDLWWDALDLGTTKLWPLLKEPWGPDLPVKKRNPTKGPG